jgi:hypothetical protein
MKPHKRTRTCLRLLCLLAAALPLAGCPGFIGDIFGGDPVLTVDPLVVSLGTSEDSGVFRIYNTGSGTLEWQAGENAAWLELSQQEERAEGEGEGEDEGEDEEEGGKARLKQDIISGSTRREIDLVLVRVDRSQLDENERVVYGDITITAGTQVKTVRVSVRQEQVEAATLNVSADSIDFGGEDSPDSIDFAITNPGEEALNWAIAIPDDAAWLSVVPAKGTITGGSRQEVRASVNRAAVGTGEFETQLALTSNGGDRTIPVRMESTSDRTLFEVLPESMDFGQIIGVSNQPLNLSNGGENDIFVDISVSTESGGGWLQVSENNAGILAGSTRQIQVTALSAGLAGGAYSGTITLSVQGTNIVETVAVTMAITQVTLSTDEIDFDVITEESSAVFQLENVGGGNVNWRITVPAGAQDWLSVSPSDGVLANLQTVPVTVTVRPQQVEPGQYAATLVVGIGDSSEEVTVAMARPKPASLTVEPGNIDFGAVKDTELVGLWNDGTGTINWSVDPGVFPAWLRLEGETMGSLSGSLTDSFVLSVDREQIAEDITSASYTIEISTADGPVQDTVELDVSVSKPPQPVLEIITEEGIDSRGVHYVHFDPGETVRTFIVRNLGRGDLFWELDLIDAPSWLVSVSPSQATIAPGSQRTVTVTIDPEALSYPGDQRDLLFKSNDPDQTTQLFLIEAQVDRTIIIKTNPTKLTFGPYASLGIVDIANFGDPLSELNFSVQATKDWLAIYPETGKSIGTNTELKDWKPVSVTADRSRLGGGGASAKLVVSAYQMEEGQRVPLETVAPVEVEISIEASPLTIESARPQLRVPSLVRNALMLRNIAFEALPLPDTMLDSLADNFTIFEQEIELEHQETNQFLTPVSRASGNVLILLDYSGSMQESARILVTTGDLPPNTADPLQELYEICISSLIQELPDNYNCGLAIFNERNPWWLGGPVRPLYGIAGESDSTRDELFLPLDEADYRDLLITRLENADVTDNGATQLYPAVYDAARYIVEEDTKENLIPFDDADIRALICVSDGRVTTPPGNIDEYINPLIEDRVRVFAVGWGKGVIAEPLVQFSSLTGGHYYSTASRATGALDNSGNAITVPVLEELYDHCHTDDLLPEPDPGDPRYATEAEYQAAWDEWASAECDQSIARDHRSQVLLSYVSLNEDSSITINTRVAFNDPNDQNSPCLEEQGEIEGRFIHTQTAFADFAGDTRMGQFSFRTEGIRDDDTARITARCEFMPRNISSFEMAFTALDPDTLAEIPFADPFTIDLSLLPATAGGLLAGWVVSGTPPRYLFTSTGTAGAALAADFDLYDANGNGALTLTEARNAYPNMTRSAFDSLDQDDDGVLTAADFETIEEEIDPNLTFGGFGDMFYLDFAGVPSEFTLDIDVLDPVYNGAIPDQKYFSYPDAINLKRSAPFLAPAFPKPRLDSNGDITTEDPPVIDFGTDIDTGEVYIVNYGGAHGPTGVRVYWTAQPGDLDFAELLQPELPEDRYTTDTLEPRTPANTLHVGINRSLPVGLYSGYFAMEFLFNTLPYEEMIPFVWVECEITAPVLAVSAQDITFAPEDDDETLVISNAGQSTLSWSIDTVSEDWPEWLQAAPSSGILGYQESIEAFLSIRRDDFDPAQSPFTFTVNTSAGNPLDVTVTVQE